MAVTHLSEKGQILIPKQLRRRLGLKPGGKVQLTEEKGRLVLSPVPDDPIAAAAGFLEGNHSLTADLRREHSEELGSRPRSMLRKRPWRARCSTGSTGASSSTSSNAGSEA